jgi:hypothetical protein
VKAQKKETYAGSSQSGIIINGKKTFNKCAASSKLKGGKARKSIVKVFFFRILIYQKVVVFCRRCVYN